MTIVHKNCGGEVILSGMKRVGRVVISDYYFTYRCMRCGGFITTIELQQSSEAK